MKTRGDVLFIIMTRMFYVSQESDCMCIQGQYGDIENGYVDIEDEYDDIHSILTFIMYWRNNESWRCSMMKRELNFVYLPQQDEIL